MKFRKPLAEIACNPNELLTAPQWAQGIQRPVKQLLGQVDLPVVTFKWAVNSGDVPWGLLREPVEDF
jgi:hypothetical protein